MNGNGEKALQRNWKSEKYPTKLKKAKKYPTKLKKHEQSAEEREREFVFICNIRKGRVREAKERN